MEPPLTSSSTVSRAPKLALPRLVRAVVRNFLAGGSTTSLFVAGGGATGGAGGAGAGAGGGGGDGGDGSGDDGGAGYKYAN